MTANNQNLEAKLRAFRENYKGCVAIDSKRNVLKIANNDGNSYTLSQNFSYNGHRLSFEVDELRKISSDAKAQANGKDGLKKALQQAYTAAVYDKIKQYEVSRKQAKANLLAKQNKQDHLTVGIGFGIAAATVGTLAYLASAKTPEVPYNDTQPKPIERRLPDEDLSQISYDRPKTTKSETTTTGTIANEPYIADGLRKMQTRLDALIAQVRREGTSQNSAYQRPNNTLVSSLIPQVPVVPQPQNDTADIGQRIAEEEETQNTKESRTRRWSEMGTRYLEMAVDAMRQGRKRAGETIAQVAGKYFRLN